MTSKIWWALVPVTCLVASPARAHFKLDQPTDIYLTDGTGNPTGGNQKSAPCGGGTAPSNMVTKVRAGSMVHIKLAETIPHGGHYRVSVAANRSELVDPTPVVTSNNCVSAPIQATPTAPALADGLFVHDEDDIPTGKVWETDVKMPDTTCANCTLQVTQFMRPHAPPCFYYHCANIEIVAADAEIPDGGAIVMQPDGGGDGGSSGGGDGDGDGDGNGTGGGAGNGAGGGTGGGSGTRRPSSTSDSGGCNVAGGAAPSIVTMSALGAMVLGMLRRRRRSS